MVERRVYGEQARGVASAVAAKAGSVAVRSGTIGALPSSKSFGARAYLWERFVARAFVDGGDSGAEFWLFEGEQDRNPLYALSRYGSWGYEILHFNGTVERAQHSIESFSCSDSAESLYGECKEMYAKLIGNSLLVAVGGGALVALGAPALLPAYSLGVTAGTAVSVFGADGICLQVKGQFTT